MRKQLSLTFHSFRFGALIALIACGALEPTAGLRAETPDRSPEAVRVAIAKSLTLIEKSAAEYRRQRECFACHHQALPVITLKELREHGFLFDERDFRDQLKHTTEHLKRGRESYLKGRGQGGKADTAGWALWTLEAGGCPPDETTAAVTEFLLQWNSDSDHWRAASQRPPTEASEFTTTYVALRGLSTFGTPEQSERIADRTQKALQWLLRAEPQDNEDRVFRLRALNYLAADEDAIAAAARDLLDEQREDGSWSQTSDTGGDAYATGTALAALYEAGRLTAEDDAYRRGVAFLLADQRDDGSWKVTTRSKPIQVYFESGFPHGDDQFISIAATCWAVQALLPACRTPNENSATAAVKP